MIVKNAIHSRWAHSNILRIIDSELFPIGSLRSQMKVPRTVWILNKFEPTRNVDQISQNRKKILHMKKKSQKIQIYFYKLVLHLIISLISILSINHRVNIIKLILAHAQSRQTLCKMILFPCLAGKLSYVENFLKKINLVLCNWYFKYY